MKKIGRKYSEIMSNKKKGFTLIELVVVIAIMAILALIMVPNFSSYIGKSRDARIQSDLKKVYSAAIVSIEDSDEIRLSDAVDRSDIFNESIKSLVNFSSEKDDEQDYERYKFLNKQNQLVVEYKDVNGKKHYYPKEVGMIGGDHNEVVTKTFYPSEEKNQKQTKTVKVEDLYELVSYDVDKGKIDLKNRDGENLEFELSGGPYDRRVQIGGEEILADSKTVSNQTSANYNSGGYTGTLSRYLHSGSFEPESSKYVTNQASSSYNSDGYTGTLSRYLHSGSAGDTKYVTEQTSSNYNSGGYSGTLSSYVYSGSAGDTKYVTEQTSSNYNSGGYTGTLSRYLHSGSFEPESSKYVTNQASSSYNSDGYTGTLSRYLHSGSAGDTKYVTGQTSSNYNSGGYSGTLSRYVYSGSYTPSDSFRFDFTDEYGRTTMYQFTQHQWDGTSWNYYGIYDDPPKPPTTLYYSSGGYTGTLSRNLGYTKVDRYDYPTNPSVGDIFDRARTYAVYYYTGKVTKPAVDTRVYRYQGTVTKPDTRTYRYQGTVTKPASDTRSYRYQGTVTKPDTRIYRYEGTVTKPDSRVYRYQGTVTKPAVDTRVYRYRGTVNRPYSDTRIWEYYYKYGITVSYIPK